MIEAVKEAHNLDKKNILACIKSGGLKLTRQREVIISVLIENKGRHLNLDQILENSHAHHANISAATIYRNITFLEKSGIIKKFTGHDKKSYYEIEERGASHRHHDHFFCLKCGAIIEFYNHEIENLQQKIARDTGFKILDHKLEIYGECNKCASI